MSVFIDWLSAVVPYYHTDPINNGCFVVVDSDGVIERTTTRQVEVPGSFDSRFHVKTWESGETLYVSGNPLKFLQGHNLFGPTELLELMWQTLQKLADALNLNPSDNERERWREGHYRLTRVDCTGNLRLDSDDAVKELLRLLPVCSTLRGEPPTREGNTVYYARHSQRRTLKIYGKHAEMRRTGHCPDPSLPYLEELTEWARGVIRLELTLRGKALEQRHLQYGHCWKPETPEEQMRHTLGEVKFSENYALNEDTLRAMPARLVTAYATWKSGRDLRTIFSRSTYYLYKKDFLKHGIDISLPPYEHNSGSDLCFLFSKPFLENPECQ
jgi:II/X family phage/plasmid replication protein